MFSTLSRLSNSWKVYSDIQRQIRYADRKVQILLAIGLAILSFSLTRFEDLTTVHPIIRYPFTLALLASATYFLLSVLLALFARGEAAKSDPIPHFTFFGHIAQYDSAAHYAEKYRESSLKEQLEDLNQQIYEISRIAVEKYRFYRRAWIALLGVLFSLTILFLGQMF